VPHTDGIDPDSCADVEIIGCGIYTSDDHISLKSGQGTPGFVYGKPTTNVVIRNNILGVGGGGIAIGSETSGSVTHVLIEDNVFDTSANIVRLKSCGDYGGTVSNITFRNLTANGVAIGIFVDLNYECHHDGGQAPPIFKDIFIERIKAKNVLVAGTFNCSTTGCVIDMTDVDLRDSIGFTDCDGVSGKVTNVHPQPCYGARSTRTRLPTAT